MSGTNPDAGAAPDPFAALMAGQKMDAQAEAPAAAQISAPDATGEPADPGADPFASLFVGQGAPQPKSSTVGSFIRGAIPSIAPTIAGLPAAGAGAEAGAAIGALAGPFGAAAGGLVGGAAGFIGGSAAVAKVQSWAAQELPASWQDTLGLSDRQQSIDQQQHGTASFLGGLVPMALTMSPMSGLKATTALTDNMTSFQRIMANPITARLFGGAAMGGMELGQEKVDGQPTNWGHVGISTAFGMLFNKPYEWGEQLSTLGAGVAHPFPNAAMPTVAQAADAKVMGPGITEAVYQGQQQQSPETEASAQQTAATEQSLIGEPPAAPDAGQMARQMHPELFAHYDDLAQQRSTIQQWIDTAKNPPDDMVQEAQDKLDYAKGQLADATAGAFGPNRAANVPRLQAQVADAQSQFDEINTRKQAWASGNAADTPDITQARAHLQTLDYQMRDMLPDIQAAHRRGADVAGTDTVEPTPKVGQSASPEIPAAEPVSGENGTDSASPAETVPPSIQQQHDNIVADRSAQLRAKGQSPELADANARIEAAAYVAHAARFKGALGGPEALYRGEAPNIRGAAPVSPLMPTPERPAIAPEPPAAAEPAAAAEGNKSSIESLDPSQINVDANRFQFKAGGNEKGVSERLQGITQWDSRLAGTALVFRDAEGKNWIADGHQRLGLAQRLAENDPNIRLNAFVLDAKDGITDADARTIAAAKNIAEGTGTPIDAAKIIRDAKDKGTSLPPMPPRSTLVRDGQSLARLSPDAFGMAVNDVVPINYAAIVGRLVDDPEIQSEAMRVLAKGKPDNAQQAELMVRDILATGTEARTVQGGLFGDEHFAASAVLERAKIADEALKQLKKDKSVFSTLVSEAERIQGAGTNSLDIATNQNRLSTDEQASQLFSQLATRKGAVSDVLTDIARKLQRGEISKAAGAREFLDTVRGAIEGGLDEGADVGGAEPGAAGQREHELNQDEQRDLFSGARGKISIRPNTRNIITLTKNANESTFVHEMAHDWLERLTADARHEAAPDDLRADAQTIHQWLGTRDGAQIPTKAHEKFARGFEQYLREGIAPSRELAGVFAKFKGWLMQIYQTIKGLGQPINEDIRQVFDRMLATEPNRTVIAAERPVAPSIADIHDEDAAKVEPAEAFNYAPRAGAELNDYLANQPPEISNEIAAEFQARADAAAGGATDAAGEPGGGIGGTTEVGGSGGEPEPIAGGGGGSAERGAESGSTGEDVAEGAGASGGASGPAGGRSNGQPNPQSLSPKPVERFPDAAPKLTDLAGNIRVENLTDQSEVAQAIHDSADRNAEFRDARGEMTKGQINDLADSMGLDPAKMDEAALTKLLGGTGNLAARILAARKLVVQSAGIVAAAMKKAAGGTDEDAGAFASAIARHDMIQSALAGVTAEWGRAGNAFHNLLSGWDQARDLNQFLKENTGRSLFQLKKMAKLGAELEDVGQVSKFVRDSSANSFGRMLMEYWINGLISGIQTHMTYTVGNGILWAERNLIESPLAASIGAVRARMGRTGDVIPFAETAARLRGGVGANPGAISGVLDAMRTGRTIGLPGEDQNANQLALDLNNTAKPGVFDPNTTVTQAIENTFSFGRGIKDGLVSAAAMIKAGEEGAPLVGWEYSNTGAIPNLAIRGQTAIPLGEIARAPSRMVAAIHSYFRCINYATAISGQAIRQAMSEGLTGLELDDRVATLRANPTQPMMEAAHAESNDLTLMGQGGELTRKVSVFFNHTFNVPGLGETQLLKFIDPFVHISSNIIDQSLAQRSPLGLFSPEIRADLLGKNGNIAADTAAAKMIAGTAMIMTFGALASEGMMSGSGPSDPHQAAAWRQAGNQPHSIRIGNIWYQVNRLGPMGMLASMAADMYDTAHLAEKGQVTAAGSSLLNSVVNNILDEGFMAGPAQWIGAIEEPDRKGQVFVQQFLSSFVPYSVGMQQMARAQDPYMRQTRSLLEAIKAKIPFMSETLMPRRDVWGQPMPNNTALINRGLTAIYEQQVSTDPVNLAMLNLGIGVTQPDRKIRNVTLNEQQYDDFSRIAGRMMKMRLDVIVKSPDFMRWPPDTQHDVINETINQSREIARNIMMAKYPQIAVQATQLRLKKASGQ